MHRKRAFFTVLASVLAFATVVSAAGAAELTPQARLGKAIFFDVGLSLNGNQSCASCHAPEAGWTGPSSSVNEGGVVYEGSVPGAFGNRKPPSSAYAGFSPILHMDKSGLFTGGSFWDGRATGERLGSPLAEQAQGPFLNPAEQALLTPYDVVSRVIAASYPVSYVAVWGPVDLSDPIEVAQAYDNIAFSIAAYEASSESDAFSSKFDAWKAGKTKLSKEEARGWALFNGKGKCSKCHISRGDKGTPALFTDFTFDNLGIPRNPDLAFYDSPLNTEGDDFVDPGLGGFLASRADFAPFAPANLGKHKVPTLRNVDKRPYPGFVKAYGHNGYFKSLEQIVHFYNTRDVAGAGWMGEPWPAPEVAANVNTDELGNLGLTPSEEKAIVAFLKTLSDGWVSP